MAYEIELNGLKVKSAEGKATLASDFQVEIKELDSYKRTFWAIASSESPDRDNDIIRIDGWNLKNYQKSPRGLWMHDYFEHPHFKTLKIKVDKDKKQLQFQPQFDTHERAILTFNQFANGFLDDFSVGFIPGQFSYRNSENTWDGGRDFVKNHELLEISAVTVPANAEASILRSAGLIPEDQISLKTIGYQSEFHFDKNKKSFWYPILLNMEAYKIPKSVNLGNGLTVIKAFPRFGEEKEMVIGYYFNQDNFKDEKSVLSWVDSQLLVKPTTKYYQISFDEEKSELELNVVSKEVEIVVNSEIENEEKDLSTEDVPEPLLEGDKFCNCENFESSEDDEDKCKGCGGKKPKGNLPEDEDNEDSEKTLDNKLEEKVLGELLQKFDNLYDDKVRSIVTEFEVVKSEIVEIKEMLLKLSGVQESLESNSDDQLIDLSELSEKDLVSPVSKNLEDDSNKIEIDSEVFKQLSKESIFDVLSDTFKEIFSQEKEKLSGKL